MDKCMEKLEEYENIVNYTISYHVTYNKVVSLVEKGLCISM